MSTFGEFQIGPPHDSEEFLQLFAIVLDELETSTSSGPLIFDVPPGLFLRWGVNSPPTIDDLESGLGSASPPKSWPVELRDKWNQVPKNGFQKALNSALRAAPAFKIASGRLICRILAGVAQTCRPGNEPYASRNRQIVKSRLADAREVINKTYREKEKHSETSVAPKYTLASKPTWPAFESDVVSAEYLSTPTIRLWRASHCGPSYTQKKENQDATYALRCQTGIAFALADGISTSYGAHFAATAAVFSFCQAACRHIVAQQELEPAIREAIHEAQEWLNSALIYLLKEPTAPEWKEVAGQSNMAHDVAVRLLDNTRTRRNNHWGPSLAATLIAGIARPANDGWEVGFIRLGDGAVECWHESGTVTRLIEMDSTQSEVSSCICPSFDQSTRIQGEFHRFSFVSSDILLISSDGLARGHDRTVTEELLEIGILQRNGMKANDFRVLHLLDSASEHADQLFKKDGSQMFADNLSLIIIESVLRKK